MSETEQAVGGFLTVASADGMLVAYDPILLKDKIKLPRVWWAEDPLGLAERATGAVALWPLGMGRKGTRSYRVRVGLELTELELGYVQGSTEPAPLTVTEEARLFVGPADRLPGDGFGDRLPTAEDGGGLVPVQAGSYSIEVAVLDWRKDDRFWTEENEPTEDAPADFVVLVTPVDALPAPSPEVKPLLEYLPQKKATASKNVQAGVTWRSKHRDKLTPDDGKPKKKKRGSGGATKKKAATPKPVVRPGELCVGATVRHPAYGVGIVKFIRDGFPKAKVDFQGTAYKVDRDQLTVLS